MYNSMRHAAIEEWPLLTKIKNSLNIHNKNIKKTMKKEKTLNGQYNVHVT